MGTIARGRRGTAGDGGKFGKLACDYYHDDRIGDAGLLAELLFVRGVAYCSGKLTDGFMTEQQVRRFVAMGFDNVDGLCETLVAVGLWTVDLERHGYIITNWLKWNRSAEEINYARAREAQRRRTDRGSVDGRIGSTVMSINGGTDAGRTRDGDGTDSGPRLSHRPDQTRSVLLAGGQARTGPAVAAAPPEMKELREKLSRITKAKKARGESATTGDAG